MQGNPTSLGRGGEAGDPKAPHVFRIKRVGARAAAQAVRFGEEDFVKSDVPADTSGLFRPLPHEQRGEQENDDEIPF